MLKLHSKKINRLFHIDKAYKPGEKAVIPADESKHIIKTLRKKEGDTIYCSDGFGNLMECLITVCGKKEIIVEITNTIFIKKEPYNIILAVGLIKPRLFELIIEKSVELGVSEITPLLSDYVEHKAAKKERWNKIAVAAIKQSLRVHMPKISDPLTVKELIALSANYPPSNKLLAKDSSAVLTVHKIKYDLSEPILVTIGPEGGFSPEEYNVFKKNNFTEIALGINRLRTETAALAALAQLSEKLYTESGKHR